MRTDYPAEFLYACMDGDVQAIEGFITPSSSAVIDVSPSLPLTVNDALFIISGSPSGEIKPGTPVPLSAAADFLLSNYLGVDLTTYVWRDNLTLADMATCSNPDVAAIIVLHTIKHRAIKEMAPYEFPLGDIMATISEETADSLVLSRQGILTNYVRTRELIRDMLAKEVPEIARQVAQMLPNDSQWKHSFDCPSADQLPFPSLNLEIADAAVESAKLELTALIIVERFGTPSSGVHFPQQLSYLEEKVNSTRLVVRGERRAATRPPSVLPPGKAPKDPS